MVSKRHIEASMVLSAIAAGSIWLFLHLRYFGLFMFMGQEEFLYPFDEKGNLPINPIERLGDWLTQLYINPMMAVLIPTVTLMLLFVCTWWWLRRISGKSITSVALAIVPIALMLPWVLTANNPLYSSITLMIIMAAACINTWVGMGCLLLAFGYHLCTNSSSLPFAFQSPETLAGQTYSAPTITAAWTTWFIAMLIITAIALLMRRKQIARYDTWIAPAMLLTAIAWTYTTLPDSEAVAPKLRKDQLATLERLGRWEQLEALLAQTKPQDMVELTYLNLALAEQGKLGDTMFKYEQHGAEGVFCNNDGSYQLNALFSDLFYLTGYLGRAEGNAMDGKQIGMPRHLRRLVEIHTIRNERKLADKYLNVLSQLRNHKQWADDIRKDKISLTTPIMEDSMMLTSMAKTMDLWASQLKDSIPNRAAAEYLGAIYLLDKDMTNFSDFYLAWQKNPALGKMPRHFDEAAAIIAAKDTDFAAKAHISQEILNQYRAITDNNAPNGTYWSYYNNAIF